MARGLRWQGFGERSVQWRLWGLALVFGGLFSVIALVELSRERAALDRAMYESMQSLRVGLGTSLEVSEREMLSVASMMAADPEVQSYLKRAQAAVRNEGGGAGGEESARVREAFAERMQMRRVQRWESELHLLQIDFYLKPGAVSFLRLQNPRRFGDELSEVRPMVDTAHSLDLPLSGFEIGRMYAGLRGLHPVFAFDEEGETYTVGSVEVGVALRDLLAHAGNRFGSEFVVTLDVEAVERVMWEDDIRANLRRDEACECYIDARDQPHGLMLLAGLPQPLSTPDSGYRLVRIDRRWYGVTRVEFGRGGAFADAFGGPPLEHSPASVFIFSDRNDLVAAFRDRGVRTMGALFLAYLLTLLITWRLLHRMARTEQALASEQRFRSALFQLSPDSILVTDREGTIVEVNPRFSEVAGYAAEDVVGRNARILQSGQTPPEVYRDMWQTLLAGKEWRGDIQNRRQDGTLYWEAHAIVPVRGVGGEITHFVSFQRDVSERHEMERALSASERLYRSIHDNVQEAIYVVFVETDGSFRFLGNNPSHRRATGLGPERIGGARPHDVFPPDVAEAVCANFRRCIEAEETIRFEEVLELPGGHCHWMTSLTPVRGDDGGIELIVGLAVDVTDAKHTESELRRLATTDVLTGLANRRHFLERAEQELERARRYGSPSAFIMLDLDHFKRINDTWGHATGDAVLRAVARVLGAEVRTADLVGRLGGEEFGVLLPETRLESALALAERLREALVNEQVAVEGEVLRFSASFGVTVLHGDDESVDMPMARADAALYAAKFAGRNRVKWRER